MVVLEAMAAGTPVLAVDSGGPRTTVAHGRTGWLLPPDAAVWADRMAEVVRGGPALESMRPAAVAAAAARSWDGHVARVDDVMEQLAQGSRSTSS